MPIASLPSKIETLTYEIATLKKSISLLETPVEAPPTAAAGSLMETMAATLTSIDNAEEQDRLRLHKLEKMRDLLSDAELTLTELTRQQLRSKPLYDAGIIRLEQSRKKFNDSIDALIANWEEFEQALKAISDDALVQTGAAPYSRTNFPMDHDWLTKVGKVGPMNAQNYYPVIRAYEFDRLHSDE